MFNKESRFYGVWLNSKAKVTREVINGTERAVMSYKVDIPKQGSSNRISYIVKEVRGIEHEAEMKEKAKKYVKDFVVAVHSNGTKVWVNPHNNHAVVTIYGYGMKK